MQDHSLISVLSTECCKRRCQENVTMAFVKKKRTEWSTFNEKVKRRELAKIIEGCLVKRKSDNSVPGAGSVELWCRKK